MNTIHRQRANKRNIPDNRRNFTFLRGYSIVELIKKADEWCNKNSFDYESQIYRVIEADNADFMTTPNRNFKQSSKYQSRDDLKKREIIYYEVKLKKVAS